MSSEPVSWLVIEHGWKVFAADGSELGHVDELVGDTGKDIFNGVSVSRGVLRSARYVPSERVRRITEGQIDLDLTAEEFEHLDEYGGAPPSEQIRPD